jgi:multiple sugar transport system ATP-binding protein
VVFGGVDYKIGAKAKLDVKGNEILLFDRKSGKLMASGTLEIQSK